MQEGIGKTKKSTMKFWFFCFFHYVHSTNKVQHFFLLLSFIVCEPQTCVVFLLLLLLFLMKANVNFFF